MDNSLDQSLHLSIEELNTKDPWAQLNLGLVLAIATCLFKNNVSTRSKLIFVMTVKMAISLSDSGSDFFVAASLFSEDFGTWAIIVLGVDYIPGWLVLVSNISTDAWREVNYKQRLITIMISMFAPVSTPLFQLRWLLNFDMSHNKIFSYNHFNARLSELVGVAFESPVQMVMVVVLYTKGKLTLPWNIKSEICDSLGNTLNLGAAPGIFSLLMSFTSIANGSFEVSEAKSGKQKAVISAYAFSSAMFRIISYTLFIVFFNEWASGIFIVMVLATIVTFLRFDIDQRRDFALLTTVALALFSPCAISKYPHKEQFNSTEKKRKKIVATKNRLAARISLVTTPIIISFDVLLLLILYFVPEFRTSEDILLSKNMAMITIAMFLLPMGICCFVAGFFVQVQDMKKKHFVAPILSIVMLITCASVVITLINMGKYAFYYCHISLYLIMTYSPSVFNKIEVPIAAPRKLLSLVK